MLRTMRLLRFHFLLAGLGLLAPLAGAPSILWSVPSTVKDDSAFDDIHLAWLNDDELIALRRGTLTGRYHCAFKTKTWEKKIPGIRGFAASPRALFFVREDPELVLEERDPGDGTVQRKWTSDVLGGLAKSDYMTLDELEWLPKDGILAVETLGSPGSKVWMFDPRQAKFKGSVRLDGYLHEASAAGDRLVWQDKAGVLRWSNPGGSEATEVWDSGLGEGGDDYPRMLAYQVRVDGGFVAVLDNGGWEGGARLFSREGKEGKVVMSAVTRNLQAVAIEGSRVWATESKTGWFGVLDLSGKVVAEAEKLLPPYCWEIAIAPSAKRAAVVDQQGTLWFIDVP